MKLRDALKAGFTVTHYKGVPVGTVRHEIDNEVITFHLIGERVVSVSDSMNVPNHMLSLTALVLFTEELAAAMLLPSGVMPVTRENIQSSGVNGIISDVAQTVALRERKRREGGMFDRSSGLTDTQLEAIMRQQASAPMKAGPPSPIPSSSSSSNPWKKPKGSF